MNELSGDERNELREILGRSGPAVQGLVEVANKHAEQEEQRSRQQAIEQAAEAFARAQALYQCIQQCPYRYDCPDDPREGAAAVCDVFYKCRTACARRYSK